MPAIMDDPSAPTIYRVSGAPPYPDPKKPTLCPGIRPRQVTLRDRQTIATVVPFVSRDQVPGSLLCYLSDQFAKEIEGGDTYPMVDPMPFEKFAAYWMQNFAGIMLLGRIDSADEVVEGKDWSKDCLGSFYIKPNYPGRSSHVCNAGFLVTDASRNRGVGRLMGESYLDWAPKLGYTYSVFNLVYETNVASCRIWDGLGFKRIGRVRGCGALKSYPDRLVDAIIYGRDLVGPDAGDENGNNNTADPLLVSEERFDKIKFYLKYGRYPNGSDRAEKSRLRSAATHYKLLENDVLMLKGKEVVSDPVAQMAVARRAHEEGAHAGINKTTSVIAEKYHWSRIKETVSDVIRTCEQCKDAGKSPSGQSQSQSQQSQYQGHYQHHNPDQEQNQSQIQNQNQHIAQPQSPSFGRIPRPFRDVIETRTLADSSIADLLAVPPPPPPIPPLLPPLHSHHGIDVGVESASRILDFQGAMHDAAAVVAVGEIPQAGLASSHSHSHLVGPAGPYAHPSDIASLLNPSSFSSPSPSLHGGPEPHPHHHHHHHHLLLAEPPHDGPSSLHDTREDAIDVNVDVDVDIDAEMYQHPIDPQIISQSIHGHHSHSHSPSHHHVHHNRHHDNHHESHSVDSFTSLHARIPISHHHRILSAHDLGYSHPHSPTHVADNDPPSFHTLLHDPDSDPTHHHTRNSHVTPDHDHDHDHVQDAVDRDMAMLIEHHDDDDDSPSPSPRPRAASTSSLYREMEIDSDNHNDDHETIDANHRKHMNNNEGESDERKGISSTRPIEEIISAGTKRSDIYDVVFSPPPPPPPLG
ncbi:hypothetical protein F4777DRAFT_589002 [Nemania sp. FL0916]|nr:hypothetical protein F4777DRAFT_589002 [Nemania sp. FL0916]